MSKFQVGDIAFVKISFEPVQILAGEKKYEVRRYINCDHIGARYESEEFDEIELDTFEESKERRKRVAELFEGQGAQPLGIVLQQFEEEDEPPPSPASSGLVS